MLFFLYVLFFNNQKVLSFSTSDMYVHISLMLLLSKKIYLFESDQRRQIDAFHFYYNMA